MPLPGWEEEEVGTAKRSQAEAREKTRATDEYIVGEMNMDNVRSGEWRSKFLAVDCRRLLFDAQGYLH